MPPRFVSEWTPHDVRGWLMQQNRAAGSEEVLNSFADNEVDGSTLLELTQEDIREELKIKSLPSRKALFTAIQQLQHLEGNRTLQFATNDQKSAIAEDIIAHDLTADANYVTAVQIWESEIDNLQRVLQDGEYGAQIHAIELERQRGAEVGEASAQELTVRVADAVLQERADADLARGLRSAGDERQFQRILASARLPSAAVESSLETGSTASGLAGISMSLASSSADHAPSLDSCSLLDGLSASNTKVQSTTDNTIGISSAASSSQPVGLTSGTVPGKCACCYHHFQRAHKLSCEHIMCHTCLGTLFKNAATDMTLWPVRCCKLRVDIALAKQTLNRRDFLQFTDRIREQEAINKMYCTNPFCSQFIDLDTLLPSATKYCCAKCDTEICVSCKTPWHPGRTCEEHKLQPSLADSQLSELAGRNGWRRCGHCGVMVELAHGCHHMHCRCGHHFCYSCGSAWQDSEGKVSQQCRCDLWVEQNLVTEVDRRVRIVERVQGRQVHEPERAAIRQQIQLAECEHGDWDEQHRGRHGMNQDCSNCGFYMRHYGFRCGHCWDLVCYMCRHHRL
eukprot:TRINITY_DN48450_c0_g1_i1.p1 TRINITY_DN48450_c0_g1~~TRINITY_DN48450_c0_g1_i1.p1  ORF type:complete len:567 (-),score=72.69 TRINITY_DN48450_c0_g1_i1:314-2014(-)